MKRHYFIPNRTAEMSVEAAQALCFPWAGYFGRSVVNTTPGTTTDIEVEASQNLAVASDGYYLNDSSAEAAQALIIALVPEP